MQNCQGEVRHLFTKLHSWQEESQREFSNIINSQSTVIGEGIQNLVEEVNGLQAQLSIITQGRDSIEFQQTFQQSFYISVGHPVVLKTLLKSLLRFQQSY